MLTYDRMKDIFTKRNYTIDQIQSAVKHAIIASADYPETKSADDIRYIKRDEKLSAYDFDEINIAQTVLHIEHKFGITIDKWTPDVTFGELVRQTNAKIRQQYVIHPKYNNEIYATWDYILTENGISSNAIKRYEKLSRYKIGHLFALSMIRQLENVLDMAPETISGEIENKFAKSTKYNYYNQISVDEIVRIAIKKCNFAEPKKQSAKPESFPSIQELISDIYYDNQYC